MLLCFITASTQIVSSIKATTLTPQILILHASFSPRQPGARMNEDILVSESKNDAYKAYSNINITHLQKFQLHI